MTSLAISAAVCSSLAVGTLMWHLVPPTSRLHKRIGPYLNPSSTRVVVDSRSTPLRIFGPIVMRLAQAVGQRLDRSGEEGLALRLRQAGYLHDGTDSQRIETFRIRQLRSLVVGAGGAGFVGSVLGMSASGVVGLVLVGSVAGLGRTRGHLERRIERRQLMMRIEIYTVDQLLALRVRAGSGVVQAVTQLIGRGTGAVISELAEAIRLHRSGMSVAEAFNRIADLSPEVSCSRTYRLLALADERGVDLAAGLLALAEDVRETRREAMKRAATKRRAAMLVPTIALLAPTLLLFVAAPLPYLLTGWR